MDEKKRKEVVTDFYVEEAGGAKVSKPEVLRELMETVKRQTLDPLAFKKDRREGGQSSHSQRKIENC